MPKQAQLIIPSKSPSLFSWARGGRWQRALSASDLCPAKKPICTICNRRAESEPDNWRRENSVELPPPHWEIILPAYLIGWLRFICQLLLKSDWFLQEKWKKSVRITNEVWLTSQDRGTGDNTMVTFLLMSFSHFLCRMPHTNPNVL